MESLKELYKAGNGPSSSHTMGPQRAAEQFKNKYPEAASFKAHLYGSLAATGEGHLTDYIIKKINQKEEPVVFILWGNFARTKKDLITNPNHMIIESAHPSPFSARNGFFGSKPFSKTNEFLKKNNLKEIDWKVK